MTALLVLAAAGPPSAHAVDHRVRAHVTEFAPSELTVDAGDTVTWVNESAVAHEMAFSGDPTGQHPPSLHLFMRRKPVTITVTEPGTYRYTCGWHGMQARLVVRPPAAQAR